MSLIPGPPRSQVQTHSLSTQNLKPYTLNPNPRTAIQVLALLLAKDVKMVLDTRHSHTRQSTRQSRVLNPPGLAGAPVLNPPGLQYNPNPRTAIQVLALLLGKDKGSGGKMVHGTTAFGDTLLLFMATAAPLVTPDPLIPHPEASRKLNSGVVCEQAGH